jgi:steroid 5-alpha reductase family enzyme
VTALALNLLLGLAAWALCTARRNVGLVDIVWPLFFLASTGVYLAGADLPGMRPILVTALVALWALRLSGYLALRNWNAPEDRRYAQIRARNEPGFAWKSLFIVFWFQALLAWVVAAPLKAALSAGGDVGFLDAIGLTAALAGLVIEAVADEQLARFRAEAGNEGRVLDTGLWRYSRHPNYFGECLYWWGIWLVACAAGAAWTVYAPVLLTFLLLRVSGVALTERTIGQRRPAYADYVRRTSAFVPLPPRRIP